MPSRRQFSPGLKFCIASEKLVPGDIIKLKDGNIVPADIRIVKAYNLDIPLAIGMIGIMIIDFVTNIISAISLTSEKREPDGW